MIKAGSEKLSECIIKLFNKILTSEAVPDDWATGYIDSNLSPRVAWGQGPAPLAESMVC